MAATCHSPLARAATSLPRFKQKGHRQGMSRREQKVLEDTGNQKYCSDHLETIQTSTSAESEQAVPTYCPDLLMSPPPTL